MNIKLIKCIKILLNKYKNLSLFQINLSRIFVSSTENNIIHMKLFFNISITKYLLSALLLLSLGTSNLSAQGWEIYFGGLEQDLNYDDFGESIINLADGGYLLVGSSESFGDDNDLDVYAIRIDVDGKEVWSNTYDEGFREYVYKVKKTASGNFILAGFIENNPGDYADAYMLEIDADGNLLWSNQFGGDGFDAFYDVTEALDGGFVFVGQLNNETAGEAANFLAVKTNATGTEEWTKELGGTGEDIARSIISTADGYVLFGNDEDLDTDLKEGYLVKLNTAGDVVWDKKYSFAENNIGHDLLETSDGFIAMTGFQANPGSSSSAFLIKVNSTDGEVEWHRTIGGSMTDEAYELIEAENGDLVIVGMTEVDVFDINVLLSRYNADGDELWFQSIGRAGYVDFAKGISNSGQGGFIMTGYNSSDILFGLHDVTVIRTDGEGNIYSNHLEGKVYFDENGNCSEENAEAGLTEWLVVAEGEENTFYGSTNDEGEYSILVDTGIYDIRILPKNNYWETCVEVYNDVQLGTFYDTTKLDFPIHDLVQCPLLTVDVSAPAAQICEDINYTVSYCNDGTIAADNAYIEIFLDEEFTFNNATLPVTNQTGNMLTFNLPTAIEVGQCGEFELSVAADCGSTDLTAYSVAAHIYPDDICTPASPDWDMSSISVNGICDADEVTFTISNVTGNDMNGVQEFVIIEDQVMLMIGPIDLDGGEDTIITLPTTGATYRLIAEQSTGHPGNSYPTVAVEGCALDGQNIGTGDVTIFQEDENDAFLSVDVQQIGNDSQLNGYPTGYPSATNDDLLLAANTPIQYHLRFENTTDYLVNRLVVRDTLDAEVFDLVTLAAGASSHAYTTEIYEGGIIKFVFEEMNLTIGEEGYVQFKVNQKANLEIGTRIANSAQVYLGYEAPTTTNKIVYHIGGDDLQDFVTIDLIDNTIETFVPNVEVSAFPNPFVEGLTIEMQGVNLTQSELKIYDESGRLVIQKDFNGNQVQISRGSLSAGILIFKIENKGQMITTGKLILNVE
ncbi:MAG: putative repeat protein (TIGR01451 family) [Saprospiraceae bacterium]|jgi:uncharacterized repeat protein (TIGR01451 family)